MIYSKDAKEMKEVFQQSHFEHPQVINFIEHFFVGSRGFVFKMPPPGSSVILLFSGGLDSVIIADVLLSAYQYRIYPLFIHWGQKNYLKELEAVNYFVAYFQKQYPKQFYSIKKVVAPIPLSDFSNEVNAIVSLRNSLFASHAVHYVRLLEQTKHSHIRTIFCSAVPGDGVVVPDGTLTAIRTINLNLCINEGDISFQYGSPALEPTLGLFKQKSDLVRYASKKHLPFNHMWSCYEKGNAPCGHCMPCKGRQEAFLRARVKDKLHYAKTSVIGKMKSMLRNIIYG